MNRWTTQQLAKRAGLADAYVRSLLIAGKIEAEKFGHIWAIPDEEAVRFLRERGIDATHPDES